MTVARCMRSERETGEVEVICKPPGVAPAHRSQEPQGRSSGRSVAQRVCLVFERRVPKASRHAERLAIVQRKQTALPAHTNRLLAERDQIP